LNDNVWGIYFWDEIANILLAIDEANLDMTARFDAPEVRIYRQGFAAALTAVATAFGLRVSGGRRETQVHVPMHLLEMLDEYR